MFGMHEGDVLAGRYRLTRPLRSGARGQVWLAEHLALDGTKVAVKLVDRRWAGDDETQGRFKREANAAAALRSPHVVQILDHGVAEGAPFVVMELLEGQTLAERLRKPPRLELAAAHAIVTQVARALTKAHAAGIVHGDLRPGHVFMVSSEEDETVKVLGFGVAATTPGTASTAPAPALPYQSPEQLKGTHVDARTDLWALGVVAYECVVGKVPFSAIRAGHLLSRLEKGEKPTPASRSRPGIPAAFDAWFLRACAFDPEQRFASAREMADDLAVVVREAPRHQPRLSSRPAPATKEESAVDEAWGDEDPTPALPKIAPAPRVPRFDIAPTAATRAPTPRAAPAPRTASVQPRPGSIPPRPGSIPPRPGSIPPRPGSIPPAPRPASIPAIDAKKPAPIVAKKPDAFVAKEPEPIVSPPATAAPVEDLDHVDEPFAREEPSAGKAVAEEAPPPSSTDVVLDEARRCRRMRQRCRGDRADEALRAPTRKRAGRSAAGSPTTPPREEPIVEAPPRSRPEPPRPPPAAVVPAAPAPARFELDDIDVDLPPELDVGARGRRVKGLAVFAAVAGAIAVVTIVVTSNMQQEAKPVEAPTPAVACVEAAKPIEPAPAATPDPAPTEAAVDPGLAASAKAEEAQKAAAAASAKKAPPAVHGASHPRPKEDEIEIPQPDPE